MSQPKPRAETRHITNMLRQATATDIETGKRWYTFARDHAFAIHLATKVPLPRVVAVIAALSPRNPWPRNLTDAEQVVSVWAMGGDPHTVTVSTFDQNLRKAIRILEVDDDANIEGILFGTAGRKILAFYHSILADDDTYVCIDGHAYAIWTGQRLPLARTPKIGAPLYRTIERAYTLVARKAHHITGQHLTPQQVQAVTWTTYKRIHNI